MSNQEVIAALKDPRTIQKAVDEIFEKVDKDKSGKIDAKELKIALKGMSKELGIPQPTDKDVEETMKALDENKDNLIDKKEMAELVKGLFQIMIQELSA